MIQKAIYIEWNDKYLVENQILDRQHKILFDLVNELFSAIQQSKGKEVIRRCVIGCKRLYRNSFF